MHGHPPSPTLDSPQRTPQPATISDPAAATTLAWATPAGRQAAARDAYRASVTTGNALTGAALGKMFGRSPRWGVDRIAEARAEANERRNGSNQRPATDADGASPALPNGNDRNNGNGVRQLAGSDGNGATSAPLPIRTGNRRIDSPSAAGAAPTVPAGPGAAAAVGSPADTDTAVTPAVRRITTTAVVTVALVAASASYDHQRLLAEMAGEGWRAWLLPLSVDGLVVAASMSMLVRRRTRRRAGPLAWTALVLGVAVSVTANVAAAEPTLVGRLVAAWPPVALLLAFEICLSIGGPHPPDRRHGPEDSP